MIIFSCYSTWLKMFIAVFSINNFIIQNQNVQIVLKGLGYTINVLLLTEKKNTIEYLSMLRQTVYKRPHKNSSHPCVCMPPIPWRRAVHFHSLWTWAVLVTFLNQQNAVEVMLVPGPDLGLKRSSSLHICIPETQPVCYTEAGLECWG